MLSFDADFALRLILDSAAGESSLLRFLLPPTVTGLSRGLPLRDDARLELGVSLGLAFFFPVITI